MPANACFLATGLLLFSALVDPAFGQVTTRLSVDDVGGQGDRHSSQPTLSSSGRYVAFTSGARNLVPGDTNGIDDIFVKDRRTGEVTRVSVDSSGNQGNGWSGLRPAVSADGRWVVFPSASFNLVPGDTNGQPDVFKHDLWTGSTTRISVADDGTQADNWCLGPVISDDGCLVAFDSSATTLVAGDVNAKSDIFLHDTAGGLTRVSVDGAGNGGNGHSYAPSLSADGADLAFHSDASNLVAGDVNGVADVFLFERSTGSIQRLTDGNGRSSQPVLSADGCWIAFLSAASDLVPADTNNSVDVFLMDRNGANLQRVSVHSNGTQGSGDCTGVSISGDGARVAFASFANNLVAGDSNVSSDIFVHTTASAMTRMVSLSSAGVVSNGTSFNPWISRDGRVVGFDSSADNLVPDDTLPWQDVFAHGSELTLEASATAVAAGDTLELETWTGVTADPALLSVSAVDGVPFLFRVGVGGFDGSGLFRMSFVVPDDPFLSGRAVSFLTIARAPRGAFEATNEVSVEFQ